MALRILVYTGLLYQDLINRVVLRRLMPGQELPEVRERQEIDTMLAETVEEWTRQWRKDGLREGLPKGRQEGAAARAVPEAVDRRAGLSPR